MSQAGKSVSFGEVLPDFARSRRVIAVEEQGHGRTSDREGPVRFESSADDVAAFLGYLEVDQADVFGFSNGASVALQAAIRHPGLVRRLVFASSITRGDGAQPELWEFIEAMFRREFAGAEMTCIVENLFEDGEWAILEWRDPKGLRGCGFFHVVDGRIRFQRGYWDELSFRRQQGLPLPTE